MYRIFRYLIIIPVFFIGCGSPGGGSNKSTHKFSEYDLAVLEETNFARTEPQRYARERIRPGGKGYDDMMSRQPVPALKLSKELIVAATGYAKYSVKNKYFAHVDKQGRTPAQRYSEDNDYHWYSGENLAIHFGGYAGNPTRPYPNVIDNFGRNVVKGWVGSDGHRANLMNGYHTEMEIGWWTNNNLPRNDGLSVSSIETAPSNACVDYCAYTKYLFVQVQIFGHKSD